MSEVVPSSPAPLDPVGDFVPIWIRPDVTLVHPNQPFFFVVTLALADATYPSDPPDIPPAGTKISLQVVSGAATIVSSSLLPVPTNGNTVVFALRAGMVGGLSYSRVKVTATVIKPDGSTGAYASNYGPNPYLVQNIYNDIIVIP